MFYFHAKQRPIFIDEVLVEIGDEQDGINDVLEKLTNDIWYKVFNDFLAKTGETRLEFSNEDGEEN